MQPEISIIVPVYNVENYLEKCIKSILQQTFKNFELILVDDGSTDNSRIICDKYKDIDSRISVIHKFNGGQSSARNVGIDNAKGRYIGFIDADDYIENDMYQILYENIEMNNADMSICGVIRENDGKRTSWIKALDSAMVMSPKEALLLTIKGTYMNISPCNKLYKKSVFDNLRFVEGKVFEDFHITPDMFNKCKKIAYTPEEKYIYVCRENSTMTKALLNPKEDIISCTEYVIENIKVNNNDIYLESLWHCLKRVWKWVGIIYHNDIEQKNKKFIKNTRLLMKKNMKQILLSNQMNIQEIIGVVSFCYMPIICKLLYKLKKVI